MSSHATKLCRRSSQDIAVLRTADEIMFPLRPLVPEREYNAIIAKRCIDSGSFVVGEVKNEYEVLS